MEIRQIKYLLPIAALSIAAIYPKPCDQVVYDTIYKGLVEQALTDNDMPARNRGIRLLRDLCRGQKSTLEYKNDKTYQLRRLHDTKSK